MAKDTLLKAAELDKQLVALNASGSGAWSIEKERLHRHYEFSDFSTAFAFMMQVAMVCETLDHHPKWTNVWNIVEVDLLTHRSGGITQLDFKMANRMESIAGQYFQ